MGQDPVRRTGEGARPADSGFRRRVPVRLALRYRGHDLLLAESVVIGRAADCALMLDSPLISRRHARVSSSDEGVGIEDLGSRNGVYVNGELVRGSRLLEVGDRIDLGGEELELVRHHEDPSKNRDTQMRMRAAERQPAPRANVEEGTRSASAFVLLGGLLDKLLALGRADEAERLMSTHLDRLLAEAESGLRPESYATAGQFAVRLAESTSRARWVDYAVRLYLAMREPMPAPQIDALHAVVRRVRGVDTLRLREYVAVLKMRAHELGPAERFAVRRIESLADVAAL